jgi:hypothetical protein
MIDGPQAVLLVEMFDGDDGGGHKKASKQVSSTLAGWQAITLASVTAC